MVNLSPKLRFPEFSGDWKPKKLDEVGSVINGLTYSPDDINDDGILVLRSSNIKENQLSFNDNVYVNTDNYNPVKENDILICVRNGSRNLIGKNALITKEAEGVAFGAFMSIYRSELNKFVFQLFATDTYYKIIQENLGATINSINNSDLKKFEFYFPLKEEQDKIADFLSKVDIKINQLSKKKELLEQYKKGIMQKFFNQEIRFKDDNGNDFSDWVEKKLGDIGYTLNGLSGKTKEDFGTGKPYIQYMQIFSGSKINVEDFGLVNINENETQTKVQYGDIFFTTSSETPNEIGTTSVLLDKVEDVYLNSFCFGYRPNSLDEIVPEFAQFLFRSQIMRDKIIPLAQGSTRFNMSKVELMKLDILLPSKLEQTKIANFLTSIDDKINHVNTQLENTKKFKKGLLQQMFV